MAIPDESSNAARYASSASNAYSSGLYFAQALRAAAAQQQQQAQKQQQQDLKAQFDAELKLRDKGYTPYMQTTGQEASGLKRRESQQVDPSRVISDPFGRRWVTPDPKPEATPQQTQADTSALFNQGAIPVSPQGNVHMMTDVPRYQMDQQGGLNSTGTTGVNIPVPDQGRVQTVPGSGQQFYRPTEGETLGDKLRAAAAMDAAKQNAGAYTIPPELSGQLEQRAGLPKGSLSAPIPHEAVTSIFSHLLSSQKPEPQPRAEGPNDWARIATDPASTPEEVRRVKAAAQFHAEYSRRASASQAVGPNQASDAKAIADGIENGTQPPTVTGLYRNAAPVRAELARRGFDLTAATRDWQAVQKHMATLNGAQQERLRQAVSFTYDSLDTIEGLYNEWKQYGRPSGIKIFNRASLATAKQLPGKAGEVAHALESQINDTISELGTVYRGGNASTDESLKLAAQNLKGEWNEQTFMRALNLIRTNLKIRNNSITHSQPAGVAPGSRYAPPVPVDQPAAGKAGQQTASPNTNGYIVGRRYGGLTYLGGDPNNQQSWRK